MNIEDIFTDGLHRLSHGRLIELADSQEFLLSSSVSSHDLVYLVQELAFRLSDVLGEQAASVMIEDEGSNNQHEYNS